LRYANTQINLVGRRVGLTFSRVHDALRVVRAERAMVAAVKDILGAQGYERIAYRHRISGDTRGGKRGRDQWQPPYRVATCNNDTITKIDCLGVPGVGIRGKHLEIKVTGERRINPQVESIALRSAGVRCVAKYAVHIGNLHLHVVPDCVEYAHVGL